MHRTPSLSDLTTEEKRNLQLVCEYMEIAYDPKRASAQAVSQLCAHGNRFVAPSTFPELHTLEQYAEDHGKLMRQVNDLRIISFDVFFAKGDRVCLRYTAHGSHNGEPHGRLRATHRQATWTATALFWVAGDRLYEFIKEWNKLAMWEQLGWPLDECLVRPASAA